MMTQQRIHSVRQKLMAAELDALVVSSAANRQWLTGFRGSAGTVVLTCDQAVLLVDSRYLEQARQQASSYDCRQYRDLLPALADTLQELGVRRAGFETTHVVHHTWRRMREAVGTVEWVAVENWVEEMRACKDETELAALSEAVAIADRAFSALLSRIQPGVSEKDLALELEFLMRRDGAEHLAFDTIVASGPRGALPHAAPTAKTITAGELVTFDFGAVKDGYRSDITRTVAVGTVDERQRELYELVLRAQLTGIAAVRPGRPGKEVDAEAREVISQAGLGEYFGHGLGHGVGLEVHEEYPRLSTKGEVALQQGMVCSVEPGVYIPGWGGIRIEDLVVVTGTGVCVLTGAPKELLVV